MKYNPAATQPALGDNEITEAPFLGGEFAVMLAEVPATKQGTITMSSSGNGATNIANIATYTPRPGVSVIGVGGPGADLALVAESRLLSAVQCTVVLNVTDDLGATTTASATFVAPARSANQSFNFGRGVAQDLTVASGAARKIASIQGIASIVGGQRGVSFAVYQLPELAQYTLVGATTEKKFGTRSRAAVGIDSGLEADAFVKLGKTKKSDLTIDSKFGTLMDGLSRFDGALTTALLIGLKEGVVTQNNFVYVKYIPSVDINLPDGDGESMANAATGKFKDHLFFEAA
jgi:hypothetical protein